MEYQSTGSTNEKKRKFLVAQGFECEQVRDVYLDTSLKFENCSQGKLVL